MEVFAAHPKIMPAQLSQANACWLYLGVVIFADIAAQDGDSINLDLLQGEWRSDTNLYWLNQPAPTKATWAVFHHCLRLTFCSIVNPCKRKWWYKLDDPLGAWLDTPQYCLFPPTSRILTPYMFNKDKCIIHVPSRMFRALHGCPHLQPCFH